MPGPSSSGISSSNADSRKVNTKPQSAFKWAAASAPFAMKGVNMSLHNVSLNNDIRSTGDISPSFKRGSFALNWSSDPSSGDAHGTMMCNNFSAPASPEVGPKSTCDARRKVRCFFKSLGNSAPASTRASKWRDNSSSIIACNLRLMRSGLSWVWGRWGHNT